MKIVEKLMTYDLIITDSHVMTPNGMVEKNIVIDSGKIKLITNAVSYTHLTLPTILLV